MESLWRGQLKGFQAAEAAKEDLGGSMRYQLLAFMRSIRPQLSNGCVGGSHSPNTADIIADEGHVALRVRFVSAVPEEGGQPPRRTRKAFPGPHVPILDLGGDEALWACALCKA